MLLTRTADLTRQPELSWPHGLPSDQSALHDLRRTFGSRVLESGSSLVEARDLLGHANISQTSTSLRSTARSLGLDIERKEQHEREQANRRKQAAQTDCHKAAECDNAPEPVALVSDYPEVTTH